MVQIGRELQPQDVGRATIYKHPLPFEKDAKKKPPSPSGSNYDAKGWEFVLRYGQGTRLFWNVMA